MSSESDIHKNQSSSTETTTNTENSAESTEQTRPSEENHSSENGENQPRRRVQLNPTVDTTQAKPVPTYAPAPPGGAPQPSTAQAENAPQQSPSPGEDASSGENAAGSPPQPESPGPEQTSEQSGTPASSESSESKQTEAADSATESQQASPQEEHEQAAAAAAAQQAPKPVDIPDIDKLDDELEAEISAAMSGDQQSAAVSAEAQDQALAGGAEVSEEALEEGARVKGTVQSIHADNVFFDLGFRSPGVVSLRQFESGKHPSVGQEMEVVVGRYDPEDGLIQVRLPQGRHRVSGNWDEVEAGQIVDCIVNKTNKGGLEVSVSSLRGFMPASQVDFGYVSDLEPYVGQKFTVQIVEANREKKNLVVSRRAYLEIQRKEDEEKFWQEVAVGQQRTGTVKTLKDYGAFVDLGGVDGLLHVGEISWTRIKHPSDVLQVGQEVEVQILSVDPEKKKIGLGLKQLKQNPWQNIEDRYQAGKNVSGTVTKTMDFGAFIELEEGVEGLVHISELDHKRVKRVTDVLKAGQTVEVQVLEVDPQRERISLSLKALKDKPEPPADEDLAPGGDKPAVRKRKGDLKGGTGGSSGGNLFGNPQDFTG